MNVVPDVEEIARHGRSLRVPVQPRRGWIHHKADRNNNLAGACRADLYDPYQSRCSLATRKRGPSVRSVTEASKRSSRFPGGEITANRTRSLVRSCIITPIVRYLTEPLEIHFDLRQPACSNVTSPLRPWLLSVMRTQAALPPCSKWSSAMQRRRLRSTLSLTERMTEQAERLRQQARAIPEGKERDQLMRRARQIEPASHIDGWLKSPGLQPPT
jgi:hypothetical protein